MEMLDIEYLNLLEALDFTGEITPVVVICVTRSEVIITDALQQVPWKLVGLWTLVILP